MFSPRVHFSFEAGQAVRVGDFLQEVPFLVRASFRPRLPCVAFPLPFVPAVRLVVVVVVVASAVVAL
jgi:hypothetical protein